VGSSPTARTSFRLKGENGTTKRNADGLARTSTMDENVDAVDDALTEAIDGFIACHPKAQAMQHRAAQVMPGGNTRSVLFTAPFPIRVDRAEGCTLHDIDGYSYVDLVGEYSAGIYGHSHPVITAELTRAMGQGLNMGAAHVKEVEFAEAVAARFNLERLRFTNSGTEANMMAIMAARAFTKRDAIMAFRGGYHGGTLSFAQGPSRVNAPFECVMADYNDVAATRALIVEHGAKLAVVILEPMLGGGGCIPASREFLAMLREETHRHGIVLIFDEVMTSRLHPDGGLSAATGITPDLKALGKYIGGGMSFGCFGGRADIIDQFDPTRADALAHAGTFNNNTLTMAAGLKGITEIFTREACVALNARGEAMKARINAMFMFYQAPMQLTGMGSLLCVHPVAGEIVSYKDAAKADLRLKRLLFFHLLEDGIYLAERGFIALSLMIGDAEEAKFDASLKRFIERYRGLLH
jgi:glutamate-1-semialdehyde 2,1-aminomutase